MERNENEPNLQEPEGAQLNRDPVVDPEYELEDDDDRQDPPDPIEVQTVNDSNLVFGENLGLDIGLCTVHIGIFILPLSSKYFQW